MAKRRSSSKPARTTARSATEDVATGDAFAALDRRVKERIVYLACEAAKDSRGGKSGVLRLSDGVQWDIARQAIVDSAPIAAIAASHKRTMDAAGVSKRMLDRWVARVREHYADKLHAYIARQAGYVESFAIEGDMMTLSKMLLTTIGAEIHATVAMEGMRSLSTADKNLIARVIEAVNDAAKIDAEQELKRTKTEQIRVKLRALSEDAKRKGGAANFSDLVAVFDELMRGGVPDSIDELRGRMDGGKAA